MLAANNDGALPLNSAALSSVALIGGLARDARVLGGGSAMVFPEHVVSPVEGLHAALPAAVALNYAVGADPRTRLSPACAPAWSGLRAVFRDAGGHALHHAPLVTGAGRWMQMPHGVSPEAVASIEISGRLTAAVSGDHQVGIRGLGTFTLAADGAVLFDGEVVPESRDFAREFLDPPERRVMLPLAAGSSAHVSLTQRVTLMAGLDMASVSLGYGPPAAGDEELLAEAERIAAASDVAVVVVGTTDEVESEGFDRATLALPGRQDELVRRVAAVNPKTIAVVNAGSPVELPWAADVAAVLIAWFPGQEAGRALADVLLGVSEPGGRLPTTWPALAADCPVLRTTPAGGVLAYDEDVFIGYRAWQRSAVQPRYPFGHGDGYTTWEYQRIAVQGRSVSVTVRNTGTRPGREVVQVYLAPADPGEQRPARWLAGFASAAAAPGEAVTVTVVLPARAFQIWDDGWRTVPGEYVVDAAHSVADRKLSATIAVPSD